MNPTVVGIDVGGQKRGYHAVALHSIGSPTCFATLDPVEMAEWCRSLGASVIAIDAPCKWAASGKSRPAEREIYGHKIHSYYTPTAEIAEGRAFYGWVRNGMRLYDALSTIQPLYTASTAPRTPCVFETFPHAVTCAFLGPKVSAKNKRADRNAILTAAGINLSERASQDYIDAGICALTARAFLDGKITCYGDDASGWIIVPNP